MKIKIVVNVWLLFVMMIASFLVSLFLQHNLVSHYLYVYGVVIFLSGVSYLTKDSKGVDKSNSSYMLAALFLFNMMFVATLFFNLGRVVMSW